MANEKTQENNSFTEYQKEMALKRRIRQQALAILRRAKDAGIPDTSMRINEQQFYNFLDLGFFYNRKREGKKMDSKDVVKLCHELFNIPDILLKTPFILIDGGDMYSRRAAGFALLFRILAWDKSGRHYNCANVTHRLQIWEYTSGESRNMFADDLKNFDAIFISEFANTLFKAALEAGSFLDEVLEAREVAQRTTIISFQQPVPYKGIESPGITSESSIGQYMMMFSEIDDGQPGEMLDIIVKKNVLRIRVR